MAHCGPVATALGFQGPLTTWLAGPRKLPPGMHAHTSLGDVPAAECMPRMKVPEAALSSPFLLSHLSRGGMS